MSDQPAMPAPEPSPLALLAEAFGVASAYVDFRGETQGVTAEALRAILEALGTRTADPDAALREHERARWSELVEPVAVAWEGGGALRLRTPAAMPRGARLEIDVVGEAGTGGTNGVVHSWALPLGEARVVEHATVDDREHVTRRVPLPPLEMGYHRAHVRLRVPGSMREGGTREGSALVLSAPRRTFRPPEQPRAFGVFAPLYSLHSRQSAGIGNLGDLARLLRWTRRLGGAAVGTLPLLATVHDDPEGVSPYAPVSRLAWDELFLDLRALRELGASTAARRAFEAASPRIEELRHEPLVDYAGVSRALWPPLVEAARHAFDAGGPRREALTAFLEGRPEIEAYARFRSGDVDSGGSEDAYRAHAFAQFALHEQLAALSREARRDGGLGLYLDLPIGTHREGFDAWRFPEAFASGLDTGAPPDAIFSGGQNWHFAPPAPIGARRAGYEYFIASVRNHLRYAGVLRVDHVMAMHRLYVIPRGAPASEGAYLRYRPDEQWAILAIESQRAGAVVIGEDLGTVPSEVRRAMRRHGVGGSYVLQYAASPGRRPALAAPTALAVGSLNTHDMPTFAAWAAGDDIGARGALGLAVTHAPAVEVARRAQVLAALRRFLRMPSADADADADGEALLRACLDFLGRSRAGLVLVSLADLLGEVESQNVPGTTLEHPNWRRRSRLSLEDLEGDARALELLALLREARRHGDA